MIQLAGRPPLTERQIHVLQWAANGLDQREIADKLHLSRHTIKRHMTETRSRLLAVDEAHAVAIAIRHGWIV